MSSDEFNLENKTSTFVHVTVLRLAALLAFSFRHGTSVRPPPSPPLSAFVFAPGCVIHAGIGEAGAEGILPLRASAFLLLATLCAVLGVRAFPHLPRFFPAMLHALEHHSKQQPLGGGKLVDASAPIQENSGAKAAGVSSGGGGRLLWTSALSAVATVAASLPSFLSPYLGRILAVALRAADGRGGVFKGGDEGSLAPGGGAGTQAADRVLSLLASGVEPRLLVPAVCASYSGCLEEAAAGKGQAEVVMVKARKVARLLSYVQEVRCVW